MSLNCSNKAAKPEPVVALSIAGCCFAVRGDDGGDDDNDDALLICVVAGCDCCVWLPELAFGLSFFRVDSSVGSCDDGDELEAALVHDLPL